MHLEKKTTWLEIDSQALNHNITHYKKIIGPHNKLAVIVKGNAYGHGLMQIGSLCEKNEQVDWLCPIDLSEALTLRSIGITKKILVLGYADVDPAEAVGKDITFMVDSIEYAQQFNAIGKKHNYCFDVHVKIDTGLSRLGVPCNQALSFTHQLTQLPFISIDGIYSHFASSDDKDPTFKQHQLSQFISTLDVIKNNNIHIEHIHMSNTAALANTSYPSLFNFFRVGLGVYGLSKDFQLKPILTWKTRIVTIKTIPADSYVSYAFSYKTTRETRIAILPVGYYDGYPFKCSNKSFVRLNDTYVPIIGRIAMNMTIIDVTNINAHVGDEVILLGNYPAIRAYDLVKAAEITNVREIFTNIKPHIPRIII